MASAPCSPELKDIVAILVERAEALRTGSVDPRDDNMLLVTTDGRKAALDLRLYDGMLPDHPRSKVNLAVAEIERVWRETSEARLTQLVFCDLSTPTGGKGFSVYEDSLEQNISYWLTRAGELGQPCADWAQGLVEQRGPIAIRTLIGLVHLTAQHSCKALNQACACALSRGVWRLRDIRHLLSQPAPSVQTHFGFAKNHPLIRNLAEYGVFIPTQNYE